jgi:hypothetical protein
VQGDICSICCGTGREVTVSCPLDCEFLQDARRYDRPVVLDPAAIPNQDIPLTGRFLDGHRELLSCAAGAAGAAALESEGALDADVREALAALIRTHRTLQSGVYYESRPANPLAAGIYERVARAVQRFRQEETGRLGLSKTRDADVLGVLVAIERLGLDHDNGRRRGRAFIDILSRFYPPPPDDVAVSPSPLILP